MEETCRKKDPSKSAAAKEDFLRPTKKVNRKCGLSQ